MPSLDRVDNFDQHANFYIRAITNPLLSTFLDPTEPQTTEENIAGRNGCTLRKKTANRLHPDLKAGDRPRPLFAGAGDFFALLTSTPAKHAMLDVLMGPELKKRFPITEDSIEPDELTFKADVFATWARQNRSS